MLKLVRNMLGMIDVKSRAGIVKWTYITKLHEIQEQFGIKLGNRLSKQHIEWEKNKIKVRYAAQTFSRSVADAIDHLREDVKHPDFKDSSATTEFIRAIDTIFDMLNSCNPHGGLAKQPLRLRNQQNWAKAFDNAVSYLLTLKDMSNQPLYYGTRKTGIVGFIIAIESIRSITIDLLTRAESPYDYVLTHQWSQDSIELWFCKIRRRGRWNNNPNALQFKYALRRVIARNCIGGGSRYGYCMQLEPATISLFRSNRRQQRNKDGMDGDVADLSHDDDTHDDIVTETSIDVVSSGNGLIYDNAVYYKVGK